MEHIPFAVPLTDLSQYVSETKVHCEPMSPLNWALEILLVA